MRLALSNSFDPELPPPELARIAQNCGYAGIALDCRRGRELAGPWARLLGRPEAMHELSRSASVAFASMTVEVDFARAVPRQAETIAARLRGLLASCGAAGIERLSLADDSAGCGSPAEAVRGAMNVLSHLGSIDGAARPAIETAGRLAATRDVWTVLDSSTASADAVYDLEVAMCAGDPPGIAIPRLARRLAMVVVESGATESVAADGGPQAVERMGGGRRMIEVLRGIGYGGWVCVRSDRADEAGLRAAAVNLQGAWAAPVVPLMAYKGDKHAPRFAPREAAKS